MEELTNRDIDLILDGLTNYKILIRDKRIAIPEATIQDIDDVIRKVWDLKPLED